MIEMLQVRNSHAALQYLPTAFDVFEIFDLNVTNKMNRVLTISHICASGEDAPTDMVGSR